MAQVNLGSIKFKWKGTYAGGTAYTIDDVVSYNGSSYICIQASTGNLPTDTAYFEQMSSAGTNGTNGTNGTDVGTVITTQGDILYRDGSGLQRLPKGTAGQVLQMNSGATAPEYGTVSSDMVKILDVNGGGTQVLALDNAFSSTYKNYYIQANIYLSSTAQIQFRFQNASNTELTTNYYFSGEQVSQSNGSIAGSYKGGWDVGYWFPHESTDAHGDNFASIEMWVHNPFAGNYTGANLLMQTFDGSSLRTINSSLQHRSGVSLAGCRFFAASGNIGTQSNVKVYGLK